MEDSILYDYATRSFRNVADSDYITARLCYRNNLSLQFLWMAEQAFEKYLKAILLYNKNSSKGINHKLMEAVKRIDEINSFKFELSEDSREFIKYISEVGMNRYLSTFVISSGNLLHSLDKTVFELRLYCNVKFETKSLLGVEFSKIASYEINQEEIRKLIRSNSPNNFRLEKGVLEKILNRVNDIKRESLIWKNLYYGYSSDDINLNDMPFEFITPPSITNGDSFKEIQNYIYFTKEEVKYIDAFIKNNKKSN
ncbi:HEPN domain-containing protein [Edaphovirga cremea]|uniref:HEPN domain-containing protein n=1 Tax=Edaphovirga cremea TaxID=2267246 RepID=UPI00398985BC